MNKKLISIVTIMAMLVVMIIPAWADGGDNTGDDNFGAAIYVKKDGVEGAYTLGTAKEFKLEFWASGIVGKQVVRTVSVTGDNQVSSIEYKDGGEWYDISGFNKEMTIASNDLDRTIRVVFDKEGRYTISYGLVNTEGQDVVKDQLNIEIADGQIKIVKETETTTSAVAETTTTATAETTTTAAAETTTPATAETTTVATAETTTTATAETTTVATAETTTTAAAETTTVATAETTTPVAVAPTLKPTEKPTTVAPTTNTNAQTTTKKQPSQTTIKSSVNVGKAVVKKAIKKKSAKKISLTLKRVKGATKYKVQIAKDKRFKKTIVTKTTKKLTYSVSNSKFKKAKKLYARAKAIVVKGGETYQGKWSKPKQVKIKK